MTSSVERTHKTLKFNKNIPGTKTIDVDWLDHSSGVHIFHNLPYECFKFRVDEDIGRARGFQRITIDYQPLQFVFNKDTHLFDAELLITLVDKMDRGPTVTVKVEMVDEEEEEEEDEALPSPSLSHSKQTSLECKVCLESYSDTIDSKTPRILTECGHTLCHSCADTLQNMSPDKLSIDCPFDRTTTKVKVDKLHKNFAIIDLIRERSDDERLALKNGYVGISEEPIIPCFENARHESTRYCKTCNADFCNSCYLSIHSSRINSNHESIPISEKPVEIPWCPNHENITADFFCQDKTCKATSPLCCSKCSKKHHKHHEMVTPIEKIEQNKIKLTDLLQNLQSTETNVSGALSKAVRCIQSTSKTESGYQKMVSSIHRHYDRKKIEAIGNLESFVEHKRAGMVSDKRQIEHDLGLIKDTKKEIEKVLKRKDLLFAQEIIEKGEAMCSLDERNDDNLFLLRIPSLEKFVDSNTNSSEPSIADPNVPAPPKIPPPPPPRSFRAESPLCTFSFCEVRNLCTSGGFEPEE